MSIVILSIDGHEVYTNSTSSSTSTTPYVNVKYTQVKHPQKNNKYYYKETGEDGNPLYKESTLTDITMVNDGSNSETPIYKFGNGDKSAYAVYTVDRRGGEIQKKKTTKVEKKKNIFQKEILNIINI
jgi:hypothetical protein